MKTTENCLRTQVPFLRELRELPGIPQHDVHMNLDLLGYVTGLSLPAPRRGSAPSSAQIHHLSLGTSQLLLLYGSYSTVDFQLMGCPVSPSTGG